MAMDAELLAERTFCKIVLPVWIERIGLRPDFQMPPDFGVAGTDQLQPDGFSLRRSFSGVRRKHPVAPADGMQVSLLHPSAAIFLDACVWPTARACAKPQSPPAANASAATICR